MGKRELVLLIAALLCSACVESCDDDDDSGPTGPTTIFTDPTQNRVNPGDRTGLTADCDPDDVDVVDWRHYRQFGIVTWDARVTAPSDCTFSIFFKIQVKQSGSVVGRRELHGAAGGTAPADHWVCGGVHNGGCHVVTLPNENGAYRIAYRSVACRIGNCSGADVRWPD